MKTLLTCPDQHYRKFKDGDCSVTMLNSDKHSCSITTKVYLLAVVHFTLSLDLIESFFTQPFLSQIVSALNKLEENLVKPNFFQLRVRQTADNINSCFDCIPAQSPPVHS